MKKALSFAAVVAAVCAATLLPQEQPQPSMTAAAVETQIDARLHNLLLRMAVEARAARAGTGEALASR